MMCYARQMNITTITPDEIAKLAAELVSRYHPRDIACIKVPVDDTYLYALVERKHLHDGDYTGYLVQSPHEDIIIGFFGLMVLALEVLENAGISANVTYTSPGSRDVN